MASLLRDVVASPSPPTPDDLLRIAAGDQRRCRDLIDRWEFAITVIARGYASRRSDWDDLIQAGRIAVYRAALNYKSSLGTQFGNYAKRAIRNLVMKEAVRLARQRRSETPLEWEAQQRKYRSAEWDHARVRDDAVKAWVRELPEPHATIFRLLYADALKQRVAAQEMGVSQARVAQMHKDFVVFAGIAFGG